MGALAALGIVLLIASVRSEEAPKGPKVTHKVSIVVKFLYITIDAATL